MSEEQKLSTALNTVIESQIERIAIDFFKWYGVKMMEFLQYFKRKLENPIPYSIPDAYDKFIEEFEGKSLSELFKLYKKDNP